MCHSVGVGIGQREWHMAEPPGEGVEVKRNMRETREILVFRFSVGNRNIIDLHVAGFIGNET